MVKPTSPSPSALRVAELNPNSPAVFALRPDTDALKALAAELDLLGLRKLSFEGEVQAEAGADWLLRGTLGATVVQPCSVTLAPVTTRIDEKVERRYLSDYHEITAPEVEMPEDDTTEPLGAWIEPHRVMIEALVLALPLYPRQADADLGEQVFAGPGVQPMRDEDTKPFASLADLKAKLQNPSDD
ncbi:hypothetical protein So717_34770 [Roseobacter cerasinus]|uniref:50S ribosomal protein L34 n=1 Tax=Roseobacter cerasinus TaxID=2602289 RepID=A0A640VVU7_9RHOB|nr:DUF177 domain-containing protein [Roseobacter cerasinus]GFE51724.1 hypothetical protein So717_34770 [Roseobacter cerasinus]